MVNKGPMIKHVTAMALLKATDTSVSAAMSMLVDMTVGHVLPRTRKHGTSRNLVHNTANMHKNAEKCAYYTCIWASNFDLKSPKNLLKHMQNWSVPLPGHGQIVAGPSPHNTESTHPAEKAWHKTIRHGAPLRLHVFFVFYNDSLLAPSQNHAFCMVFYPHTFLLQCILTCVALSSSGVTAMAVLKATDTSVSAAMSILVDMTVGHVARG
jgi:hypothetical protein